MSWAAMAAKGSTLTAGTTKVELPKEVVAAGRKVVLDSGAIIKGGRLESLGERFWTIQEVVNEIRDSNARMVLETTSADIQVRQVDPEALAFVTKFAKLTGDFAKLSTVDLKVMALTYQLEKQFCGTTHLNERPKPVGPRPAAADAKPEAEETAAAGDSASAREGGAEGKDDASEFERVPLSKPDELDAEAASKKRPAFKMGQNMPGWYDGEDDDKGWITPDNIQEVSSGHMESRNAEDEHVACATMDFAMQNVLLQIGLRVLNMDGMVVRSTKQFVLKCHGCYKICPDTNKNFCPSCGNATLMRVSMFVKDDGTITYSKGIKNFSTRGTKYSLPLPTQGRGKDDLVLREDQLAMSRHRQRGAKETDDDGFSTVVTGRARKQLLVKDQDVIGLGYAGGAKGKNPNTRRGGR